MSDQAAPGWYVDPEQAGTRRYWDGSAWTDQRAPDGSAPAAASSANRDRPAPGWYPDPQQVQTQRYWDGDAWTDQRAPAAPATRTISEAFFCVGAAAFLAVGSVGTWVDAGIVSIGGLNGDGTITLGAALVALVVGLIATQQKSGSMTGFGIAVVVVGLVAAATAIYDLAQILGSTTELFGEQIRLGNPGWGLWLAAASAIGLCVSGFALAIVKRPS